MWTSGYSRAGATANLASGLLDQAIDNGEHPLGEGVSLAKEDLYAYCFEPPMGAPSEIDEEGKLLARSEKYSNIFNHVNFNDVVPLVAMNEVNFTRFGKDRYYPDSISYFDCGSYESTVRHFFERLPNYEERGGKFLIPSFKIQSISGLKLIQSKNYSHWTQGLFLREFVNILTRYGLGATTWDDVPAAKEHYYRDIQPALRFIFDLIYLYGNFKGSFIDLGVSMINDILSTFDLDELINELVNPELRQFFFDDLSVIIRRGLKKVGIENFTLEQAKEKLSTFVGLLLTFVETVFAVVSRPEILFTWFSKNNISSIASGHFPELCLAATRALDSNYVKNPFENSNHEGKYFTITYLSGNASFVVKDSKGRILAECNEGEIIQASVPTNVKKSEIRIVLPYGEEYLVQTNDETIGPAAYLFDYHYRDSMQQIPVTINLDGTYSFH